MKDREIITSCSNILSLISCASTYGFADDVLFDAFSEMIDYTLSDQEIEDYARSVEMEDGYGKEDYLDIKEELEFFKSKYCKK